MFKEMEMRQYKATIPMHLEFVSEYDQHDSSTSMEFHFETSVHIDSMNIIMMFPESGEPQIIIENVSAETEAEAFMVVVNVLPILVSIISLQFQRHHANQHYGHVRVKWYKGQINIIPRDQWVSDSAAMKLMCKLDTTGFQEVVCNAWSSEEIKFLLQAYYGSLQSQDYRAKYYHAFTIIEFIENKYRDEVGTKRFKEEDCTRLGNEAYKLLEELEYSKDDCNNGRDSIINLLKKITKESRANKLLQMITERLDIKSVKYLEDVPVDRTLVGKFIETRNKLFHAGNEITELKRNTDLLILVSEKIVWKFSQEVESKLLI
jgi:hypothetical protein